MRMLVESTCLLTMQVLGGLPEDVPEAPEVPTVQGHELQGGPQMLQLSCAPSLHLSPKRGEGMYLQS